MNDNRSPESLPIEHVLAACTGVFPFKAPLPFGWAHRISDTYRLWALKEVFAGLNGEVLDYGCGDKPYEQALRHAGITAWIGVDFETRTSGIAHVNKADRFLVDGRIPYGSKSFDIALATQVFEHVEDLGDVLEELKRVLRPNGLLIATCPMTSPLHEEPFDFRRFTPYGMRVEARKHGFNLIRSIALGGPISTIATMAAVHASPIGRVPFVGKSAHRVYVEALTRAGLFLERLAFRGGFRQCSISFDYLFVLACDKPPA